MPLQTQNLVMTGLGVEANAPPNALQPRLVDGIHLRWAFKRDMGFPWYGFYLYRRRHGRGEPMCVSRVMANKEPGALPSQQLATALGQFRSDQDLVLTDDFPPAGMVELDLRDRAYLRFELPPAGLARWVQVEVGFRKPEESGRQRQCVDFRDRRPSQGPNPRVEETVEFTVHDETGAPTPQSRVVVQSTTIGPLSGLDCGHSLEIKLPFPADEVDLQLTHFAHPAQVEAFHADGSPAAGATMVNPQRVPEAIRLVGHAISRVVVKAPADETLLHEVCYVRHRGRPDDRPVTVTALLGGTTVGQTVLANDPGQVVTAVLEFDAISAIEFTSSNAAVVDICIIPVAQGAASGWSLIRRFPYPLCLPVTHTSYPCSGNAPVDEPAAQARALGRVRYGSPSDWAGAPFADLHEQLLHLVEDGPGGPPMASKRMPAVVGAPDPPDPAITPPKLPAQSRLDMVLLGTLNPAVAQMVGLYYVDEDTPSGAPFDYMIVADYLNVGGRNPSKLLSFIQTNGFDDVQAYIVFNQRREPDTPLPPPDDVRCYELPGTTRRAQGGALEDADNNAGLRWDLGLSGLGILQPGHAIMYHVWRAALGNQDVPDPPGAYDLITRDGPTIVGESHVPGSAVQRPANWPPFPLHHIDIGLSDGWYGYQVSGIDIFGRHSPNSGAGQWYEWLPVPDPRPWYYQDPPGDRAIHPSAVRLLDKTPPPPPTGFEAFALDPADPFVIKDATYAAWWATLSSAEQNGVIGLRVRWLWTFQDMRQAPQTREFRVYYHPGQANALLGRTTAAAATAAECQVQTDIPNAHPADAFRGGWLRIGGDSFRVVGSDAADPLRVRVRNLGLTYGAGSVTVASGSATVTGAGTVWHAGMTGLSLEVDGDAVAYTIHSVNSPTEITLTQVYAGPSAAGKAYIVFDLRPRANAPCTLIIPDRYADGTVTVTNGSPIVTGAATDWVGSLAGQILRVDGELGRYRIQSVDTPTQLTLARNYDGPGAVSRAYAITFPLFTDYSVPTSWDERYYVVDYNDHVSVGVDGAGNPLRTYEVLLPAPGDVFRGGVPLNPTLVQPIVYALVAVSAADGRLHTPDDPKWAAGRWGNRLGNEGPVSPSATIFRVLRTPPPPPAPPPDSERVFATAADYHSASYYTYRWWPSANLKTHVFRAMDEAIFRTDWGRQPRAALDAGQLQHFPDPAVEPRWDALKRGQVAAELNQLNAFPKTPAGTAQAIAAYRALSNDGLRVLAGLPGNEAAFSQITLKPLDPDDPANANRLGPDNAPGFPIVAGLRAYVDKLDGRSTNRYFYRAAYVDAANNQSPLSLSGPPIWLPDVVPPKAPSLTKALGGDREITLRWASNREPDLAEYRVFRADAEDKARDTRLMTLVHTEAVAAGEPMARPAEVSWTDAPLRGLTTFFYRLVAVDDAGNVSSPTPPIAVRAHDETPPVPPALTAAWADEAGVVRAQLTWTSADEALVQRRDAGGGPWIDLVQWRAPGSYTVRDPFSDPAQSYEYRIWARRYTGAIAKGPAVPLPHN